MWTNIINISQWVYYFDIKDISTRYTIKWNWFEINNKWPWSFIVNNIENWKNIIFSENALLDLNLKNIKNNEQITSVDLFPHTYLIFNPIKNIFV